MPAPMFPWPAELLDGQYTPVNAATAAQPRSADWWENRSIPSLLTDAVEPYPERTALVGRRSVGTRVTHTYCEFDLYAHQVASMFASLGVEVGYAAVLMPAKWVDTAERVFGVKRIRRNPAHGPFRLRRLRGHSRRRRWQRGTNRHDRRPTAASAGVAFGCYDRPDAIEDSYFRALGSGTGDPASADENGWLSLHGRTKDIIIRGGENTLSEHLLSQGLSKHCRPERIAGLLELPMTPSRKIQKFRLRELVA